MTRATQRLQLKACPRCRGDVLVDYDPRDGWEKVCLACGWRVEDPRQYGTLIQRLLSTPSAK